VRPRKEPPRVWLWQLLSLLLLLVIAALLGAYFLTRPDQQATHSLMVPPLVGLSERLASQHLRELNLVPLVTKRPSKSRSGTVFAQDPAPATQADRGAVVRLSVSTTAQSVSACQTTGPVGRTRKNTSSQNVRAPNVLRLPSAVACRKLKAAGFSVQVRYVASRLPADQVIGQSPAGGYPGQRGTKAQIVVSRGPT
jgi:beta-lactam-binding protein with PASTA domain